MSVTQSTEPDGFEVHILIIIRLKRQHSYLVIDANCPFINCPNTVNGIRVTVNTVRKMVCV
jgi:hypothetical protein